MALCEVPPHLTLALPLPPPLPPSPLPHRALQMGDEKKPKPMALGEAVSQGIIGNETLAYFIGRTWLFFKKIGIDPQRMRFRQHLQHEVGRCG